SMEPGLTPAQYREVWERKPALRAVYRDYARWIDGQRVPGVTIEIGAGPGNLGDVLTDVIPTDVTPSAWVRAAIDAHALPFRDGAVANIIGVDVLHHLERPVRFLAEAQRVLADRGRIVLVEPGITPVSWVSYKLFHPEPVDLRADPLADGPRDPDRDPADANQAIPTLLAGRWRRRAATALPGLRLMVRARAALFAYPLSGGFRRWSLVPARLVAPLLRVERALQPALGRLLGFRVLLVYERRDR